MKTVCRTLWLSRSHRHNKKRRPDTWQDKRKKPEAADTATLERIRQVAKDLPTYGYRRIRALLHQDKENCCPVNHKKVYRLMKACNLLLSKHCGTPSCRFHDGKIAMPASNQRWCSDGFEIACDNWEKVQVAFSLDCCDRKALAWVATSGAIDGGTFVTG